MSCCKGVILSNYTFTTIKAKKEEEMKKIRYLIITLMIILVCSIPVIVYAEGESNPGGGQPTEVTGTVPSGGGGGSQILREYGYIVSLQSVNKNVTSADAAAMKGNNLTSCTLSIGKELMYKFPVSLTNSSTAGSSRALLQHPMDGISPALKDGTQTVYYTAGNHTSGAKMTATVYPYGTSYTTKKWDYTQGPLYKKWKNADKKTKEGIERGTEFPTRFDVKKDYSLSSSYVQSVMYLFADYSNAVSYINERIQSLDDSTERMVVYFDLCAAINSICNNKFTTDLNNLYKYKNSDAATKFLTITVAPAIVVATDDTTKPLIFNLPSYFAACSGGDINDYTNYSGWNGGYTDVDWINGKQPTDGAVSWNYADYYRKFMTKYYFGGSSDWYAVTSKWSTDATQIYHYMKNGTTYAASWLDDVIKADAGTSYNYRLAIGAFACNTFGQGVGGVGYSYIATSPVDSVITTIDPPPKVTPTTSYELTSKSIAPPNLQFALNVSELVTGTDYVDLTLDLTQEASVLEGAMKYYDINKTWSEMYTEDKCVTGRTRIDVGTLRIVITRLYTLNGKTYTTDAEALSDGFKLGSVIDTWSEESQYTGEWTVKPRPNGYIDAVSTKPGITDGCYCDEYGLRYKNEASTIIMNNVSRDTFEGLLNGTVKLHFRDTDIPIPDDIAAKVNVEYYASVSVSWGLDLSPVYPVSKQSEEIPYKEFGIDESAITSFGQHGQYATLTHNEAYVTKVVTKGSNTTVTYLVPSGSHGDKNHLTVARKYKGMVGDIDTVLNSAAVDTSSKYKDEQFKGSTLNYLNITDNIWAKGSAYTKRTPDPEPKEYELKFYGSYQSKPETGYAEVKQGVPYGEEYEAMAGTPTDATLFINFGGSLAIANMGVELKKDFDGAARNYIYKMTFENCIESNDKCTWSCPGHTLSIGGCGALAFCTGELNAGEEDDYDADGNKIGSHYTRHEHTDACYCNSGETITYTCIENGINGNSYHQVHCACGATENHVDAGTDKPNGGVELKSCTSKAPDRETEIWCTGLGCVHSEKINEAHPHSHTFTGTVTQNIGEYVYADIEELDLWGLDTCTWDYNKSLIVETPNNWSTVAAGYQYFINQGDYFNNNGRMKFSTAVNKNGGYSNSDNVGVQVDGDKNIWGDIVFTAVSDSKFRYAYNQSGFSGNKSADEIATGWFNSQASATTSNATVISDYCLVMDFPYREIGLRVADTKYQSLLYHDYTSKDFDLVGSERFSTGSDSKMLTSSVKVDFTESTRFNSVDKVDYTQFTQQVWDTMWTDNQYSTAKCNPNNWFVYGGYNGEYGKLSGKYNKSSISYCTSAITNAWKIYETGQPNMVEKHAFIWSNTDKGWPCNTLTGFKVIDNTFPYTYDGNLWTHWWETSDGKEPVTNGIWDTGKAYERYKRLIDYHQDDRDTILEMQVGIDIYKYYSKASEVYSIEENQWDKLCTDFEVGYTIEQTEVNDIVIYDPIALNAEVLTRDSYYDDRVADDTISVDTEHDSVAYVYELDCTITPTPHTEDCYTVIQEVNGCTGVVNAHMHTDVCYSNGCTHDLNVHVHTDECSKTTKKVLTCTDPHHYSLGQAWDVNDTHNHYSYGDSRCWKSKEVDTKVDYGTNVDKTNVFINLDGDFDIRFSYEGRIFGNGQRGLLNCDTNTLGGGWSTDSNAVIDTRKYVREQYVKFPFDVKAPDGNIYTAGTWILLKFMPNNDGKVNDAVNTYTFHCLEENNEGKKVTVEFFVSAINEEETLLRQTNNQNTNLVSRAQDCYSQHRIDVVGSIGALTLTDTGDFRFANFFKNSTVGNELVQNVVPSVDEGSVRAIAVDTKDVLKNTAIDGNNLYRSTYGVTGKKGLLWTALPLTPADNNIESVKEQLLRPGYKLYMDVETVGNYYGVNFDSNGNYIDYNGTNKMVITPRYWALDLDTGKYTPLDVYASTGQSEYVKVVDFDDPNFKSDVVYNINWADEVKLKNTSSFLVNRRAFSLVENSINDGYNLANKLIQSRRPWDVVTDYIGTANKIVLYDVNTVSIGSSNTYGVPYKDVVIPEERYQRQSQRWFFETGLPSSAVFVEAGLPCTDVNIKSIQKQNMVIACALNIRVRGTVWTLQYDGSTINFADTDSSGKKGIKISDEDKVYEPPKESDGEYIKDPIVVIYDSTKTSKDDLSITGTH